MWAVARVNYPIGRIGGLVRAAMLFGVLGEQRHPRERLVALLALVLLYVAVRLQVSAQVGSVGERPVADLAAERLLAGVRSHVALQQPRTTEALAAVLALARQRVRSDVHLQGAHASVDLRTELARELLAVLLVTITMELEVLAQAGLGRVRFAAVRTREMTGIFAAVRLEWSRVVALQ